MTSFTDIQEATTELDEFLSMRTEFVRSTVKSLLRTLTSDPIGVPSDRLDLMDINASVGCDPATDAKLFHTEDPEGCVGFSLRFSLGSPVVMVRWRFSVSESGIAANVHDSPEVIRTHLGSSGHEAFVKELAERTLRSLLHSIKRLKTESTWQIAASHPMKKIAASL